MFEWLRGRSPEASQMRRIEKPTSRSRRIRRPDEWLLLHAALAEELDQILTLIDELPKCSE